MRSCPAMARYGSGTSPTAGSSSSINRRPRASDRSDPGRDARSVPSRSSTCRPATRSRSPSSRTSPGAATTGTSAMRRSRVEINTDLPIHAHGLPGLVAHEAYPGHHTEHALKDMRLYHGAGLRRAGDPIDQHAGVRHLGGDRRACRGHRLRGWAGGVDGRRADAREAGLRFDPEVHRRIQRAGAELRAVASNAALLFHRDGRSEREVVQYLEHYGLMTEAEAAKRFSFISDPLWRPYIFTYSVGRQLLSAWLDQADGRGSDRALPPAPDRADHPVPGCRSDPRAGLRQCSGTTSHGRRWPARVICCAGSTAGSA